jgi:hypothetical protein
MSKLFIILLILFIILLNLKSKKLEKFTDLVAPNVKFPFRNLIDENNKNINVICLTSPFRSDQHRKLYNDYIKMGLKIIGVTSYQEFPGKIVNPYEDKYHIKNKDDYVNMVMGWCYIFRDPKKYGIVNKPMIDIAESDFSRLNFYKKYPVKKEYDFICVCLKDNNNNCHKGWQAHNRNWELTKKLIPIMCNKYKLKGFLVGRKGCGLAEKCNGRLIESKLDLLPYWDFIKEICKSKFLFIPNIYDASPRTLTQSLSCNVPVLLNYNILGGWKYINKYTGEFFNDEKDFEKGLKKLIKNLDNYKPHDWYSKNYGPERSGKRLRKFIEKIYPEVTSTKLIKFKL